MVHLNKTILTVFIMVTAVVSQDDLLSVASPNLIFETLGLNGDIATSANPKYYSPADLVPSPDKTKLYVAEQTAKQIAVIDVTTDKVTKTIKFPNEVTGIAVSGNGLKLYVTSASDLWPEGYVYETDASTGKILNKIKVGHSPRSPVLSPDDKTLYVCNQFTNDISAVDLSSGQERRIKAVREPYAARITPDGKTLLAVNSVPMAKATDTSASHCIITLVNLTDESKSTEIALTQGSNSVFALAITPDGKYALITHLIGYNSTPSTRVDAGWIHTNNVAIIDIDQKKLLNDISLDFSASIGCANPWGIDVTVDGKFICIAHAGSNEISIIDFPGLIDLAKGEKWLASSFNTLKDTTIRKRVAVEGRIPRALAIIDNSVYTAGYFSNFIEKYDISLSTNNSSAKIELGSEPDMNSRRNGEYQYYSGDKNHCVGSWQSCSSCHPQTRSDGMNWILSGANGAPKNSKSLLYSWWTPPNRWGGKRVDTREVISLSIKYELGLLPADSVQIPIENFLKRLKPVASPYLDKGRLTESAKRGKNIFYDSSRVDCIKCHSGKLFTNLNLSKSIVNDIWDAAAQVKIPGLNECWRSVPWDHIGSTTDMVGLITGDLHSNALQKLTKEEVKDLSEFILSL